MTEKRHTIIRYLCSRYDVSFDDIRFDGSDVHVTGIMPNTSQHGEFFAGYVVDLARLAEEEEIERLADAAGLQTADD